MAGLNFYNLQPLDNSKTHDPQNFTSDQGTLSVQFCRLMTSYHLEGLGCKPTAKTMAAFKDANGACHILSGQDTTKDADFSVDNITQNNGLQIQYKNGDGSFNLKLNLECDKSFPFFDP